MEEDERQAAGLIETLYPIGYPPVDVWRWPVARDRDLDSDDPAQRKLCDLRTVAAVDKPARQVKQKIDDAYGCGLFIRTRSQEPCKQLFELGSDALQSACRGKQRIENWRPHRNHCRGFRGWVQVRCVARSEALSSRS